MTFIEFVNKYFPENGTSTFHREFIEQISKELEKSKPGSQLVISGRRDNGVYLDMVRKYNGIHADTLVVAEGKIAPLDCKVPECVERLQEYIKWSGKYCTALMNKGIPNKYYGTIQKKQ